MNKIVFFKQKSIKSTFLFLIIIFTALSSFSLEKHFSNEKLWTNLSLESASWTCVTGGRAITKPASTSYGFVVLTDGKMLCACLENGKKIWEKSLPGKPDPYLTVLQKDFLLTVTDKKKLSLVNPSGNILWTVHVPFSITADPIVGRDSRIFVSGSKNIACYGMNGILKWKIQTKELSKLPVCSFNDGSILAIHEELKDGKTEGIRISPFGQILENITFAGIATNIMSCHDGIILSFSGGGAGLCSVTDGKSITQWAISHNDAVFSNEQICTGGKFIPISLTKTALLFPKGNDTKVFVIQNKNGNIISDFLMKNMKFEKIECYASTGETYIFACEKKEAYLYDLYGNILWKAKLPSDKAGNWNYAGYTDKNHLVLCGTSWLLTGFRVIHPLSAKSTKSKDTQKKLDYTCFYNIKGKNLDAYKYSQSLPPSFIQKNRYLELQKGNYSAKEKEWMEIYYAFFYAYTEHLCTSYSGGRISEKSVFESDEVSIEFLINEISYLGISDAPKILSRLILLQKNESLLVDCFRAAGKCGFDPDGKVLEAISKKLDEIPASSTFVLIELCQSVFEICKYMGRPALYDHGMELLKKLLFPQYGNMVREKARKTLSEIAKLKL